MPASTTTQSPLQPVNSFWSVTIVFWPSAEAKSFAASLSRLGILGVTGILLYFVSAQLMKLKEPGKLLSVLKSAFRGEKITRE